MRDLKNLAYVLEVHGKWGPQPLMNRKSRVKDFSLKMCLHWYSLPCFFILL